MVSKGKKLSRALLTTVSLGLFVVSLLLLFDFFSKSQKLPSSASVDTETEGVSQYEIPEDPYHEVHPGVRVTSIPEDPVTSEDSSTSESAVSPEEEQNLIPLYLVLDDAGASVAQVQPFLSLSFPFTVSIIPGLAQSRQVLAATLAAEKEPFLHLPLEPIGEQNPGTLAIMVNHSNEEIRKKVTAQADSLPGIRGVNNHMGSRATQDERVMRVILEEMRKKDLLFLDSRTTANSVVPQVADSLGFPIAVRNVFLDHERSEPFIHASLEKSMDIASEKGYAVMIGHVTVPLLAEILKEEYPRIEQQGFQILPITEILKEE